MKSSKIFIILILLILGAENALSASMENLKETEKYIIFEPEEGEVPESLDKLEDYLRKLVIWQENLYKEIALRVNWSLSNYLEHSDYIQTLIDDANATEARETLNVIDQATYTVYVSGSTYYAQASPETGLPDYSNSNFVDLMDDVMAHFSVKWGDAGDYVPGASKSGVKVIIREGAYWITKSLRFPPLQNFVLDASFAGFAVTATTESGIIFDSLMNCRFHFGEVHAMSGTSGATILFNPITQGADSTYAIITSTFVFGACSNPHATGSAMVFEIGEGVFGWNTISCQECQNSVVNVFFPDLTGAGKIILNDFHFKTGSSGNDTFLLIGQTHAGIAGMIHNTFHCDIQNIGRLVPAGTGINNYADKNTFYLSIKDTTQTGMALQAGCEGNLIIGQFTAGYGVVDLSENDTNLVIDPIRMYEILASRKSNFLSIPTNAGWNASNVNTGAGYQEVFDQIVSTGAGASSRGLYSATVRGFSESGEAYALIDWSKKLIFVFNYTREASDAQAVARVQIKEAVTEGAMGTKGIGIRVDNLALFGESYGTALGEVDLSTTLVSDDNYQIAIIHYPGSRIEWYVNGTLAGTQSTSTKIPSGMAANPDYLVHSIINGAAGGTDCLSFIMQPRIQQER